MPFFTTSFRDTRRPLDIQWINYEIEANDHDHLKERALEIAKEEGIEFKGFLGRPHDEPRVDLPILRLIDFPLKPEQVKKDKVLTLEGVEEVKTEFVPKKKAEAVITPEQLLKGVVLDSSIEAGRVKGLTEFAPKKWVVEWLTTNGWKVHGRYNSKERAEKMAKLLDEAHDIEARVREE